MSRLPKPGGDDGSWGDVLNDFLNQSHNADGSIKNNVVTSEALAGDIPQTKITNLQTDIASKLNIDQATSQTITNGQPIQDTLTASQLVATDANKKLQTLPVETYPSLTELSYVKGLTSGAQGQLADITNYLVCKGFLNQTGTNAPVLTTIKDTLLGVWTRTGVGTYILTKTGAFTLNKTIPIDDVYTDQAGNLFKINRTSTDVLTLFTYASTDTTVLADGVLTDRFINIEVYN